MGPSRRTVSSNPCTPAPLSREAGFTFMEVMVALAIVAAMMVTLIYTTNFNLDVAGRHEAITVATMLAREKMTEVRRESQKTLTKKGKFPEPFEDFAFEVEVKDKTVPILSFPVKVTEIVVTVTGRDETVNLRKILQRGKVSGG